MRNPKPLKVSVQSIRKSHPVQNRRCTLALFAAVSALAGGPFGWGAVLTVNGTANTDERDAILSFTEAILVANGELATASLTAQEQAQIQGTVGSNDRIEFAIPGPGPHAIRRPSGVDGFPTIRANGLTIDGYTQADAKPNTNPILAPNTARLEIAIDARDSISDADGEGRALSISGNHVVLRGLSFLSSMEGTDFADGSGVNGTCWGVVFADGAVGGQVAGCWVGLHPDGRTVAGGAQGLEAYGSGGGQVFGTNGDGIDDRAEFNIIVGHDVNIQADADDSSGTPVEPHDVRVSGNFIGVMPDGLSAIPAEAQDRVGEGDAIEGAGATGLLVGTDANGVADEDERNVIGGMKNDVIELWDLENRNVRVCGNYIGVGVDGQTPIANQARLYQSGWHGRVQLQLGSDLDGVRDEIEANLIAHGTGVLIRYGDYESPGTFVALRGNRLFGNTGPLADDRLSHSLHNFLLTGDPGTLSPDIAPVLSETTTRAALVGSVPVSGPGEEALAKAVVDVYVADPATVTTAPQGLNYLGSFEENGPQDLDPAPRAFRFDLSGVSIPGGGTVHLVVASFIRNNTGFDTSVFSNPVPVEVAVQPPTLHIQRTGDTLSLTWDDPTFTLEWKPDLAVAAGWSSLAGGSPRTVAIEGAQKFYRLIRR